MNCVLGTLSFLIAAMASQPCLGQDVLGPHKINALKGLRSVAIVIRAKMPHEVVSINVLGDMIRVGLHRTVPDLAVSDDAEKSPDWLELSIITTDAGGFVEISLYRWVKVLASGAEVIAKVWWGSRSIFGGVSKHEVQQALDTLLMRFAVDYLRSKQ